MLISVTCGGSSSAVGSGGSGNRGSAPGPEQVPDAVKMCGATSGGIASFDDQPEDDAHASLGLWATRRRTAAA